MTQLDDDQGKRLEKLLNRVYTSEECEVEIQSTRLAPSLICRSEAEFFTISMPRFAVRASLSCHAGFVNIRRNKELARALADWDAPLSHLPEALSRQFGSGEKLVHPISELGARLSIAEAVLKLPRQYEEYAAPQPSIGSYFDESVSGVPYAQSIRAGGGLCSQAACYMISLLMHERVKHVYGIAEITVLAQRERLRLRKAAGLPAATDGEELHKFDGMDNFDIACFFRSPDVGMTAHVECARSPSDCSGGNELEFVCKAMYSYLRSGFALILPCDFSRMSGDNAEGFNVFTANGLDVETRRDVLAHAVVVVGAKRIVERGVKGPSRYSFLFNDPATEPFLEISGRNIRHVLPYKCDLDDSTSRAAAYEDKQFHTPLFISPLPKGVDLSLLSEIDESQRGAGLFDLDRYARQLGEELGLPRCSSGLGDDGGGVYRLVSIVELQSRGEAYLHALLEGEYFQSAAGLLSSFSSFVARSQCLPEFVWAVFRRTLDYNATVWVYDTRAPLDEMFSAKDRVFHSLIAILADGSGEPVAYERGRNPEALRVGLLTSFSPKGLSAALNLWPPDIECVEVYEMMQEDVPPDIAEVKGSSRFRTAVKFLSDLERGFQSGDAGAKKWIGDHINRLVSMKTGSEQSLDCNLIASFVPQISAVDGTEQAAMGRSALAALTRIAEGVSRSKPEPCRPMILEVVCGALVDWLVPVPVADSEFTIFGNLAAVRDAQERAVRALRGVIDQVQPEHTFYALELEPGPLYALRDFDSLWSLLELLQEYELDSVGLNLDISHFLQAGIPAEKFAVCPKLCDRVLHCHLSGHEMVGHFGDRRLTLGDPRAEQLLQWLSLMRRIGNDRFRRSKTEESSKPTLPFSWTVSLEYEAAPDASAVVESAKSLKFLVDKSLSVEV